MDELAARNLMARNIAAASFVAKMRYHFRDYELQIEDVDYEELEPDPNDSPAPVAEFASKPIKTCQYYNI